jgi:hypothetical protein
LLLAGTLRNKQYGADSTLVLARSFRYLMDVIGKFLMLFLKVFLNA